MKNILIVEDNIANMQLLTEILRIVLSRDINEDFNIITANNGLEAVEIAKKESLDLIFMDFQMPIMGGGEATIIIKEEVDKDIPVILLTAYLYSDVKGLFKDVSYFNEFILKPTNVSDISKVVKKYLS